MRKFPVIVAAATAWLALGLWAGTAAAQCPMCRTALTGSAEGQALVAGFNNGILFLLAVPIVIFCTVVFLLWRAARKQARLQEVIDARIAQKQWLSSSKPPYPDAAPAAEKGTASPFELAEPA